jgi:DNA helicase-2/ATP-dependent DNA helicase PcrA
MYKIETNYRSSKKIVSLSNCLVDSQYGEDKKQFKKILSPMSSANEGTNVNVMECKNTIEEADVVGDWITELIQHHNKKPEDFYVLYRMNAQSRPIEDALIKLQIPYIILGSIGFYDRATVKDILSFLLLIKDKSVDANNAFKRIANISSEQMEKHYRGFGLSFFEECGASDSSLWEGMKKIVPFTGWYKKKGINDFISLMNVLAEQGHDSPKETIQLIRKLAYDRWLSEREGISDQGDNGVFDDVNEMEEVAGKFNSIQELLNYVIRVRKAKEAQKKNGESGVVTLATVHKVKGLEKSCVALVGMSNGILPHWKALGNSGGKDELPVDISTKVEDERCICFVGVTRARDELLLTYPLEFRGKPMERSMFLSEMKLDSINIDKLFKSEVNKHIKNLQKDYP